MAKYRILYCFIALCLALFYIFCYSYVPLLVIIVFAVVTVFSLAVSIFSARKISIEIKASHPVAEHGEDVNVEFMVTVTNKSFFPVSILGFSSEIQDLSEQGIIKRQYITGVSAKESREVYIFAKTEHCSYIECRVNNVFVCDAFGLVKYKLKSQNCKAHTTVVPSLSNDTYIMPDKLILSYDSDKYSDYHKGDDPSQVFEVREYIEGDDLRRIHRPLSTKLDTLMIKEYSKAVEDTCSVIIETGLPANDAHLAKKIQDGILSALFRLSDELVSHEKMFTVYWYSYQKNSVMCFEVRVYEDVFPIAEEFLSIPFSDKKSESLLMTTDEMTAHFDKQIYYLYSPMYCDKVLVDSLSANYNMTDVSIGNSNSTD